MARDIEKKYVNYDRGRLEKGLRTIVKMPNTAGMGVQW